MPGRGADRDGSDRGCAADQFPERCAASPGDGACREFQLQPSGRLADADKLITAGDYYANFSQYSMSKAIKGLALHRNFQDDQNYVRAAYGTFDGRWAYAAAPPEASASVKGWSR